MRLYVDGQKVADREGFEHPVRWQGREQTIRMGSGYVGKIDDLAIFGRALSAREIKSIYRDPEGVSGVYLRTYRSRKIRK